MNKEKPVATYKSGKNEIWDYRGIPLRTRIRMSIALIFFGFVEIRWKGVNDYYLNSSKKENALHDLK